jgi:phosphatidylinositol-3-phosphatase
VIGAIGVVSAALAGAATPGGPAAGAAATASAAAAATSAPYIRHVFVIVLENESASTTFGPSSPAPYLSKTLTAEGAYVPHYYGIGHDSSDNYIAMISGQAPNVENQADCQYFVNFTPATIGAYGQTQGEGCVYPPQVQTIAGQFDAAGLTWRDYDEGMGADPTREPTVCAHPGIGAKDETEKATSADEYATRHNPFVYFHSIIDDTTLCDSHVVNLDLLPQDLSSAAGTPNYTFITPDLCDDGHDSPCANGDPGGLAQADGFLREWVPRIMRSPAFKTQGGLLIITSDEAATSDSSSCCGEIPGPGSPKPGISGPGGGDVGAVLLSPCIAPGTVSDQPYNHYAMLRSVEDFFGLAHLGYAALPGEQSFGSDVFTRACAPKPAARIHAPALASSVASSPRIMVRWSGSDGAGAGVASFAVQVRTMGGRKAAWRTLQRATKGSSIRFKGKTGKTYEFRVRMTDLAGLTSGWATTTTTMPNGVAVTGGHYSGPWRIARERGAWENRARVCSSTSCGFTLAYRGGPLEIIGDRDPQGGVVRITLNGHTRTIALRSGRRRVRQVIFRAPSRAGRHHLTLRVVRGSVALEGFAIA